MKRKVLLQCIVAGLIQLLACIVIYIFNIQNPNIVLFVVLSAVLVLYGYVAGTVTGIISFIYSAFFFSTDHSFFIYTPVNRDKLIVVALGIVANVLIIGALKRANQKAIKNITRLEIEQQKAVEFKKLADKAESANKAKTIFLSNISHDIRTPLNGIIGLISLCKKHVKDDALIKEDLRKMEIASDHLKSLVNDVLELSRIDEGRENIIMLDCVIK